MTRAIAIALVLLPLAVFAASMWEYEEAWMQAATAGGGVALPTPFIRWDAHNGAATNDQIITALASTGSDTRSLTNTSTYAGRLVKGVCNGYDAIWIQRSETRFYYSDAAQASWQFLHASNTTVVLVIRTLQGGFNPQLMTDDGNGSAASRAWSLSSYNGNLSHRVENGGGASYTVDHVQSGCLTTGQWTLVTVTTKPGDAIATNRSVITVGANRYAANAATAALSTGVPSFGFRFGQFSGYPSSAPDYQFALAEIYVNNSEAEIAAVAVATAAKYGVTGP